MWCLASWAITDDAMARIAGMSSLAGPGRRGGGGGAAYQLLNFVASGNLTMIGNGTDEVSIYKSSGSNNWDNHAYTTTGFQAPVTLEFFKPADWGDNGASYAMIGWNTDPTSNASYDTIDYAAYPFQQSTYYVYHNGSNVLASGSWSSGTKWYLTYDLDGWTRHYNGSTLMYQANRGAGSTVYVDTSFYAVNSTYSRFNNIKVIKKSWNGTAYV